MTLSIKLPTKIIYHVPQDYCFLDLLALDAFDTFSCAIFVIYLKQVCACAIVPYIELNWIMSYANTGQNFKYM